MRMLVTAAFGAAALRVMFGLEDIGRCLLWLLELTEPVLFGVLLALILNVPMSAAERTFFPPGKGGRLRRRLSRPVSLLITLLILGGVLILAAAILLPRLTETVSQLSDKVPELAESISGTVKGSSLLRRLLPEELLSAESITGKIQSLLQSSEVLFRTLTGTLELAAALFSGLVNFLLALVFAIYMLLRKEELKRQLCRFLRVILPERTAGRLCRLGGLCKRTFSDFIAGQTKEACILGLLCIIGMELFGFPNALEVGVLVTVTAFIPVVGAFAGAAAGAFFIMFVSLEKAMWFLVFMIVLQQLEDNLIYPRIVGKSVGLPPLWVLFAVTAGGTAGGIGGMFVAVPVCSVIYTLVSELCAEKEKQDTGPGSDDPPPVPRRISP